MTTVTKLLFAIVCLPFLLSACKTTGGHVGIGINIPPSEPPPPVVATKPAPPPHAPAHGRRAKEKYQYRYYPDYSVYYDSRRGVYFYLSSDRWTVSAKLPTSIKLSGATSVSIELGTEKPYEYYDEHAKKYPPGQAKKKDKKNKHNNGHGRWD